MPTFAYTFFIYVVHDFDTLTPYICPIVLPSHRRPKQTLRGPRYVMSAKLLDSNHYVCWKHNAYS